MKERWQPPRVDSELRDLESTRERRPQRIAVSRFGMVATQHYLATDAGIEILGAGGNAIDAAVAAAFALGVCEPAASGLGGQTMMMVHLARTRRTFAIDGSSRAPNRAIPGRVDETQRRRGYMSTTVPTTPLTLAYALKHYGTFALRETLHPAIRLANDGYPVSALQRALTRRERRFLREGAAARFFLKDDLKPYRRREVFRQPILANTLERLAKHGTKDFYSGRIANLIHQDMVRNGGLIRKDDLAQIQWPLERRPVSCRFGDARVVTFPPPGAGRTLVEMLNIVGASDDELCDPDSLQGVVHLARVMQQAYRDRRDRPFDPNHYPQVSDRRLLSVDYARQVAMGIQSGGETTHLSVMDKQGNVVGLTQSIERVYGSCTATAELGFLYNNYMMAFEHLDISHPYYLRPNAVPWASVAPTIVFRGRVPWLVIGSPGSERITSSVLQVLLRLMRGQSPLNAVQAARFHCSIDGKVSLESTRMRSDIPERLAEQGFTIDDRDPYSFYLGCVQMVLRESNQYIGVADPRRDGSAGGPNE